MKCLPFATAAFFCGMAVATAAESSGSAAQPKETNFLEILAAGGLMMYPLALMSVVCVVLVLLYLLTIRRNAVVSDRFMSAAEAMIRKRDYLGLTAYCHRQNQSMARITQRTLDFISSNPSTSFENVREVAQTEGSRQAGMLTSRITYLADIGAIAPMVGLLGTVIGMIKAFIEIAIGSKEGVREMGLAEGVSEALIATAGGLAISIVALAFYSFFRGRVQKYTGDLEAGATHLIALLHDQFGRHSAAQSHAAPAAQAREQRDYGMPVPSPLGGDRRDIQGI